MHMCYKKYLILYFLVSWVSLFSQIPAGYYNTAQGLTGNNLKIALHNIIKNHTQISYNNLWNAFPKTDKKLNGKVWDIYSNVPSGTQPYEFTFSTNQCGNYSAEGDCYNREHSWPQSWFNQVTGPVSDLFHIYPTDGKVNGERSNYPYGNVAVASITTSNGSKLGSSANLGYSLTVFEPIDEYKGDIARSYFYMSTRYYSEDSGWSTSDATNKSDILPWEVNVLLQWNQLDPVSAKEIARNDSIYYKFQHNRNPFIDNPQWINDIWTTDVTVFVKEMQLLQNYSISPNPANSIFTITNKSKESNDVHVKIYDVSGKIVLKELMSFSESTTINCENWSKGLYIIQIASMKSNSTFKFIKD
jgi:endonuclease I